MLSVGDDRKHFDPLCGSLPTAPFPDDCDINAGVFPCWGSVHKPEYTRCFRHPLLFVQMSASQSKRLASDVGTTGGAVVTSFQTYDDGQAFGMGGLDPISATYYEGEIVATWTSALTPRTSFKLPKHDRSSVAAFLTPSRNNKGEMTLSPSYFPSGTQRHTKVPLAKSCTGLGVMEAQDSSGARARRMYATGSHDVGASSARGKRKWVVVSDNLDADTWKKLQALKLERGRERSSA